MKTLPTALATHYAGGTTTLADLLKITRKDGQVFAFTSASTDVTIASQLYTSAQGLDISSLEVTAGLAVDNLELTTLDDGTIFSRVEVLAGVWRNADFVISRYNWANPADGIEVRMVGTVGEVHLKRGSITAELRGLQQYLQQPIGSVTSKTCRARLGDSLCARDLADMTYLVEVSGVTSRQVFSVVDAGSGPSDPDFASVSLLLHGESLSDSSLTSKTVTAFGNAAVSTAQSKFGGSSFNYTVSGDQHVVATTEDFNFGIGDFTIEWHEYPTTTDTTGRFHIRNAALASTGGGNSGLAVGYSEGFWYIYINGSAITFAGSIALNAWSHIALVRFSGTVSLYVNGVFAGGGVYASSLPGTTTKVLTVGAYYDSTFPLKGYIDELRITKGVARYTANFTPPIDAFLGAAPSGGALPSTADLFAEGLATWTSGANDGLTVKVKTSSDSNVIALSLPMVSPIALGDTMTLVAGCRKRLEDCSGKFANAINFQGEPHLPGIDAVTS